MSTLERAIVIASEAHAGATDKGGEPYILHPLRVMMRMKTREERIAAVLHDVVEDTEWTFARLREEGFNEEIVRAVDALTRRETEGETYEAFVCRAAADPIARAVKKADLEDNMNLLRLPALSVKVHERLDRYHRAWLSLQGADLESTAR